MREWLIEIRKSKKLTQEYIATKVKITREYYSMIESGLRRPSPNIAMSIAEILGFDWKVFFENTDRHSA